jgi:hypothetical protein
MYTKLARLRNRRIDNRVKLASQLNEAWDKFQTSEPVRFALGAMQPIDHAYTKKSFEEADRVASQLTAGLTQKVVFDHQGSTTNDTHIKAASDIDLLTLLDPGAFFVFVESPLRVEVGCAYAGNTVLDLATLKQDCIQLLNRKFPQAQVSPGSKSIAVEGGSLARKVDVVPSAWRDTIEWRQSQNKIHRGVCVLNTDNYDLITNKPFLHNQRLHDQDLSVLGGLRKSIRLMKSVKFDATIAVELSSYHICGIAYTMPPEWLTVDPGHDLLLLVRSRQWCEYLRDNSDYRSRLLMPNGTELLFGAAGAQVDHLQQMIRELRELERDIATDNLRPLTKLAEARFDLPTVNPFLRAG